MIRTRVGYAGGLKKNPTYSAMGDHTETVQVDYDPQVITFEQLLQIFWDSHRPTDRTWSRQYMNAVFYHDDRQRQLAEASKKALAEKSGFTVRSKVAPLRSFTLAEDYHQKYLLKGNKPLLNEMKRIYPRSQDLIDSTAAARLNGYLGRNGSTERLAREIDRLGLSEQGKAVLSGLVDR